MKEKLHPFHIAILIYMHQMGIAIFNLPRLCAEYYGTNGWLCLLPISGLAMLNIVLISLVYRLGGGRSVFDILESFLPGFLRYPLYIGLASLWAMLGCMAGKKYVLIFEMTSFPATDPMMFKLGYDILLYFFIIKGIYNIAKASTVFFFTTIWMLLFSGYYFKQFDWDRLTHFVFRGGTGFVDGGAEIFTAFLGYELCLFLFPYADSRSKWFRSVYIGHLGITVVYVFTGILAFGFFSLEQMKITMNPLLEMTGHIELPIIERVESLLYALNLFNMLVTSGLYFWMALEVLQRAFPMARMKGLALVLVIATYCVSFVPDVFEEVSLWLRRLSYAEIGVVFGLPLLLIAALVIRKGRRGIA